MTDELKPCPLCGSSCFALIIDGIELGSCSKEGCALWDNMRPIKEWQTRPIEDELRAECERVYGHTIPAMLSELQEWKAEVEKLKTDFTVCCRCGHTAKEHTDFKCTHSERVPPPPGFDGADAHCMCMLTREDVLKGGE